MGSVILSPPPSQARYGNKVWSCAHKGWATHNKCYYCCLYLLDSKSFRQHAHCLAKFGSGPPSKTSRRCNFRRIISFDLYNKPRRYLLFPPLQMGKLPRVHGCKMAELWELGSHLTFTEHSRCAWHDSECRYVPFHLTFETNRFLSYPSCYPLTTNDNQDSERCVSLPEVTQLWRPYRGFAMSVLQEKSAYTAAVPQIAVGVIIFLIR